MIVKTLSHDLVVIGAGSGGYAAARVARERGADVAMVDHGPLGGLCILRGCMPSKTLLASSDALQDIRDAEQLGITAGDPHIDFRRIMQRKREIIAGFAEYRIEAIRDYPLYEGPARFLSPSRLQVGNDTVLEARRFIVATGSVVAPPAIPGLREAGYIDSDGALELSELPKSLIVLGGGYVGAELGQFFARMGVKTTIALRSPHLLSGGDHDIGHALTEYYREEGIDVLTQTLVERVEVSGGAKVVHVRKHGVHGEIVGEQILYALGRVPNIEGLDLDKAGVRAHPITGIEVDLSLRTSNPHIFAVGDVSGRFLLVHVATYQGEIAARNAIDNAAEPADYSLVKSHTIFSEPQVAVVGDSERDLQSTGVAYIKASYDFAEHGKAIAIGRTKGFVKMMAAPDTGKILGAAVLGPAGSDLIHEMIVAMHYHATVFEFTRIPHLHPTLAEIWMYPAEEIVEKIAAVQVNEIPIKLGATG
ncbi:MAG: dihydrolipoyl dehydrogenase [Candidatus Eremiobacteraeota bacterium]|nr:dihydrolipoyl dehydrogenase [Candidatus Eremiobacteraeota bacterium]